MHALTQNQFEPGRMKYLRQFIMHNLPSGERLELLYKKMRAQKLDEIIDCVLQGKPTVLALNFSGVNARFFGCNRKNLNLVQVVNNNVY